MAAIQCLGPCRMIVWLNEWKILFDPVCLTPHVPNMHPVFKFVCFCYRRLFSINCLCYIVKARMTVTQTARSHSRQMIEICTRRFFGSPRAYHLIIFWSIIYHFHHRRHHRQHHRRHHRHPHHAQGWRDISNFTRDLQQPFQLYRESEQTYLQVTFTPAEWSWSFIWWWSLSFAWWSSLFWHNDNDHYLLHHDNDDIMMIVQWMGTAATQRALEGRLLLVNLLCKVV